MYREKIKNTVLVGLIILCIIQTAMLWLGDSSGLNFLTQTNIEGKLTPIYPEATWVTLGEGTLAYQIESTTEYTSRQYDRLVDELQNIIVESLEPSDLKVMPYLNWGELLSTKGIWYEYAMPITIDELSGSKGDRFKEVDAIDHVFLKTSDGRGSTGQIFFISAEKNRGYEASLKRDLTDVVKVIEAFTTNSNGEGVTYQATITSNVKDFVMKNTFVPAAVPLQYEQLQVYNPIGQEGDERIKELEEYLDSFFDNPLIKTIDERPDGSVILSERSKTMLVHKPNGMVEYVNLLPNRNEGKMTRIEGYNEAMNFIISTKGIPNSLKKHLYLTQIEESEGGYTYSFDLIYGGYKVRLSQRMQEQLGSKSVVQITVKNHQISGAKWLLAEIGKVMEMGHIPVAQLEEGYVEPINKMLDQMNTTTPGMIVFEQLECVYLLDSLEGKMSLYWGVHYNEEWYYPNASEGRTR